MRVPYWSQSLCSGVGSCGILPRILAHKAAINFMRMTVSIYLHSAVPFVYGFFDQQMMEDSDIRRADRITWHLRQVENTYKVEKPKGARDLLLHQALEGGADDMEAVQKFKDDPRVLQTFKKEASTLLQGHTSRAQYNVCLGLLAACLLYL